MDKSVRLFLLASLLSSLALASENADITRRKSSFDTDTDTYKAEVYIVCSNEGTTVISHVMTLDPITRLPIQESYQGSTVSTTAARNGSVLLPEVCFLQLKSQWKEQVAKSTYEKIKDKILRRRSIE